MISYVVDTGTVSSVIVDLKLKLLENKETQKFIFCYYYMLFKLMLLTKKRALVCLDIIENRGGYQFFQRTFCKKPVLAIVLLENSQTRREREKVARPSFLQRLDPKCGAGRISEFRLRVLLADGLQRR